MYIYIYTYVYITYAEVVQIIFLNNLLCYSLDLGVVFLCASVHIL